MVVGFDDAAAAAGFASLAFTAFRGCVQALEFARTARQIGKDGVSLDAKLQWEQYRLVSWGQRAGLDSRPNPDPRLNWHLLLPWLQQLDLLLSSAEELRKKYSLNVSSDQRSVSGVREPESGVGHMIAGIQPDFPNTKYRIIQASNGVVKRLRWAASGKDKLLRLAGDVAAVNDRLEQLLELSDQAWLRAGQEALLRDLISRSPDTTTVEEVRQLLQPTSRTNRAALEAAAKLKQIRLTVGADFSMAEHRAQDKVEIAPLTRLSAKKLSPLIRTSGLAYEKYELASYNDQPVLLEWRVAEPNSWPRLIVHLQRLAVLLCNMDDPSFHSLPCRGYMYYQDKERCCLTYRLTQKGQIEGKNIVVNSLEDLIVREPHVSLNCRLKIAKDLAETVLQIHTAGWLHKAIRPANILFVAPSEDSVESILWTPTIMVGYGYARADTKDAAAFTELPDSAWESDIYRHPQARGPGRRPFEKQFDLYSLGCVLLELALWRPLADILPTLSKLDSDVSGDSTILENDQSETPSLVGFFKKNRSFPGVLHAVGATFLKAICSCFDAESGRLEKLDASLDLERKVVNELGVCSF
jgi:hypothetical protein